MPMVWEDRRESNALFDVQSQRRSDSVRPLRRVGSMARILAVSDCRCTNRHASTQDQQPLPPYPALLANRPRCLRPVCERAPLL